MNAPDPTSEGLLLADERDELLLMLFSGHRWEEIDQRATDFLLARGVMTAWEAQLRTAGRTMGFLFGGHRLFACIGSGETYGVYLGQLLFTGRVDVLKVMHVAVQNEERLARHLKKLRLQRSIDSPRFVAVYDFAYTQPVIAVEHVPGQDLRALVRVEGPLPMTTAAKVLSQTAAAIGVVHDRELAHGSIQPNKVLVGKATTVKLCDAGEGEPLGGTSDLTLAFGRRVDFVPPEILAGGEVTTASDVYSLGCLLYYAVTGKVPFPGGNADDKRRAHLDQYPLDPRRLAEHLDDAFVAVLADMMAKRPNKRIQSTAEVISRLEPWAPGEARRVGEQFCEG